MYRDSQDRCPRCGIALIDARAARGCPQCRGLWVSMEALGTMAKAMQQAPMPLAFDFEPDPRQPLPCPMCNEAMATWKLFTVPLDRCDKHGVWFDPDELAQVLLAVWVRSTIPA